MSSIAPSKVSVTKSEVSQVDYKLKANATKQKLKALLKQIDTEKTGYVKHEVFFKFLELHQISLKKDAVSYLKNKFSKNQTINYKDAVNQITIDLQAAGGIDEEANESELKWTVFALEKPKSQVGGDSVSQAGDRYVPKAPPSERSAKSFLSREKLVHFQKEFEQGKKDKDMASKLSKQDSKVPLSQILSQKSKLLSIEEAAPKSETGSIKNEEKK